MSLFSQYLIGPQFQSPSRKLTTSVGVTGPSQTQAVTVLKAKLQDNFLEVRKQRSKADATTCFGGFETTEQSVTDVLPHELVFVERAYYPSLELSGGNMDQFVTAHPPYASQFLTGGIQLDAFSAWNGLENTPDSLQKIVFVGVATSPQTFSNGITGFTVQTSGSVTIENLGGETICAGDWIEWAPPAMNHSNTRATYTVRGNSDGKILANVRPCTYKVLVNDYIENDDGDLTVACGSRIIGRAMTNALPCQNFDIMLHT